LSRVELAQEAIRLTRMLHAILPDDGEVAGLLALMLLTDARRAARTTPDGLLVPLDEQDRTLWDQEAISEGVDLITWAMSTTRLGPYQLQAAIAAVHSEAKAAAGTDWRQILGLYTLLESHLDSPVVTLNRAVAVAKVRGPAAGLALLDTLRDDERVTRSHRYPAVRAHLLELQGDVDTAAELYLVAAKLTTNAAEQRYLRTRAMGGASSGEANPTPPHPVHHADLRWSRYGRSHGCLGSGAAGTDRRRAVAAGTSYRPGGRTW
jgi:predicted RNA polymerase sigma factor